MTDSWVCTTLTDGDWRNLCLALDLGTLREYANYIIHRTEHLECYDSESLCLLIHLVQKARVEMEFRSIFRFLPSQLHKVMAET